MATSFPFDALKKENLDITEPLKCGVAVFVTDFFRCPINGMPSPTSNRKLMLHLLRTTLTRLGWTCSESYSAEDGGQINTRELMNAMGIAHGIDGWAKATSTKLLDETDIFLEQITSANLVLSWGLTPALASVLDRRRIPYLDIEVSPLRFCADLFWYARTNHASIRRALQTITIADNFFWNEAASLNAALAWRGSSSVGDAAKRYGVFVGQTPVDLALVEDGKIRDASHFPDQIAAYFSDVDEILFAPHPYDTNGVGMANLPRVSDRVTLTTEKMYRLLCADNAKKFLAISSSVIDESIYFMKDAKKLALPDRDTFAPWTHTGPEIAHTDFWQYAMDSIHIPKLQPISSRTLASLLGVRWGLDGLI
jgi:hypothetical protein